MQYAIAHEVGSAALNAIPFGAATKTALVLAGPQKPPPAFIWTASRVQTFLNYMLHDQEYAGLLKGGSFHVFLSRGSKYARNTAI